MKSRTSDLDGTNRTPFQARSLAPVENRVGRRDKLIAYSQQSFATPRKQVVEKLNRWLAGSVCSACPDGCGNIQAGR